MHLLRIEAHQFRNLSGSVEFSPGLNFIVGANAQGKSNWLEAVYILSTSKSFRATHLRDVIAHGSNEAILRGAVLQGSLTKELQLLVSESTKQTLVNGKREPVTSYLGNLDAVAFTADDLAVIRGAPDARRRFLDRGVVGVHPSYLGTLAAYNRALKQKNRLLKDAAEAGQTSGGTREYESLVEPWNDQLLTYGSEMHSRRMAYVEQLRDELQPRLFGHERIEIRYASALEGKGDLSDYRRVFQERLLFHLRNELAAGHSLVGPHRDDLGIVADGYDLARFGSSGQQRSALLLLDLAQMLVYHKMFEEYPLFLVDDVDAELDRKRIETLLDYLEDKPQTIVSTSKRSIGERYRGRARLIFVASGRADGFEPEDDQAAFHSSEEYLPAYES
jgi:DNA replication and repair protein RecF